MPNSKLLWNLLHQHETLIPGEQKIAVFLWTRLIEAGGVPIELSIEETALGTELSSGAVQKHRTALIKKGAIRLLSAGRRCSRYALPEGVTLQEAAEPEMPAAEVEVKTPEEEISALIEEMTGRRPDREFVREAQERAGGRTELIQCLKTLKPSRRDTRSPQSLLVVIRQLRYSLGLGERSA